MDKTWVQVNLFYCVGNCVGLDTFDLECALWCVDRTVWVFLKPRHFNNTQDLFNARAKDDVRELENILQSEQ